MWALLPGLGRSPRSGIAGSPVTLFKFLRNCQGFSQRLRHFTSPPAMQFLPIPANTLLPAFFYCSHL